ncbi:MAG TPA: UDP-N-acetylglucosamine 2-epimerase (non-hydrolyzing) [Chloroflexia bacterium]|jgi:UDP-N-acetylglucosamine 2-epimerase (non-hydrolysing)
MICTVVGARPNFMKMAPVILEARRRGMRQVFVHTGQHYDKQMSAVFFDELEMPEPDVYLGVGSGSHAQQTARILTSFETICLEYSPRLVVVAGDVNSTLACALAAAKLNIHVAHVEAGLRSYDRSMPEETNRVLTDHLSELLFTTEPSGKENLRREGIASEKIYFVGNSMIDSVHTHLPKALARQPWRSYDLQPSNYGVVTLHRPSNVDDHHVALELVEALNTIGSELPLIFPIHPRTLAQSGGLWNNLLGVRLVEPLGYIEFLGLLAKARVVITDSGGVQEETTALRVPCVTVRHNTERPITITEGTNRLVPPMHEQIVIASREPLKNIGSVPELWDGKAGKRIVDNIERWLVEV